MKTICNLTSAAALTAALTASANAAAVALFDFGSHRGTATAQNFINSGMSLVATTDTVTLVDNTKLATVNTVTPTLLGSGISLLINNATGAFTYGISVWSQSNPAQNANVSLLGDAWLFNGLGASGTRTITLSGLSTALAASTTYRIYLAGSYTDVEFSQFGSLTYDSVNYGSKSGPAVVGTGSSISNVGSVAVGFDIITGTTVADTLTFTVGHASGSGPGGAPGIQGIAIVPIPEPSSLLLGSASALLLCLRRRRA